MEIDFRETQQDLTELNGDGNRERGCSGEDLRKSATNNKTVK